MRLHALAYIRANTHTPQCYHRDIPLSHRSAALTVFGPVNMVCPDTDPNGSRWRNAAGTTQPMASHPGDVFIMDSRTVHRGGGLPMGATTSRVMAFAAVVADGPAPPNYDYTVPMPEGQS